MLTGNVNDVWDVLLAFYRGEIGDCSPGDPVGVPRHTYDADIRGRREVFDCVQSAFPPAYTSVVPFNELPTAPQPVSPKFTITLCFNAAYICLELRAVDCWFG